MEFKEALSEAVKQDTHTHTDPFLLYSHVSDLVGNDYEAKKAAEEFFRLDTRYGITKSLLSSLPVCPPRRADKLHYFFGRLIPQREKDE